MHDSLDIQELNFSPRDDKDPLSPSHCSTLEDLTPSNSISSSYSSVTAFSQLGSSVDEDKPSFNYDLELFNLCNKYLENKNHHGLALIARQKGLPPFLRFKIWPILLKYHPFVLNPFIQPDNDIINRSIVDSTTSSTNSIPSKSSESGSEGIQTDDTVNDEIRSKIKKDLSKYIQRLRYNNFELSETEKIIFEILEHSIHKFIKKWSKIIKYDQSLTWIALNLAEWFPPISNTPWVLSGRDHLNNNSYVTNIFDDYSNYIEKFPELANELNECLKEDNKKSMSFHEVYERLVLVLLHSPEERIKHSSSRTKIKKSVLPINGGTIEERVSLFIYCLRKLLPELSQLFLEEQILNKFGNYDDEWLIWWLKYCGSKVWSKYDRGRIWDRLLGWRLQNPKKSMDYYLDKLDISKNLVEKLGPDIFWTVGEDFGKEEAPSEQELQKTNSFKDLINQLNKTSFDDSSERLSNLSLSDNEKLKIPFAKLDPHIEILFISIAFLESAENTLVELDQHEIRQFLSRFPTKAYKYKQKQVPNKRPELPNIIISNDSYVNYKLDFMDNIINESGELWRKWLWNEIVGDD